jgi:hypothetical protein
MKRYIFLLLACVGIVALSGCSIEEPAEEPAQTMVAQ